MFPWNSFLTSNYNYFLGSDTGCSHKVCLGWGLMLFSFPPQSVKKRICHWTQWTRKTRMDLLITSKLNSCCSPLPLSAPHKQGTWFHLLRSGILQLLANISTFWVWSVMAANVVPGVGGFTGFFLALAWWKNSEDTCLHVCVKKVTQSIPEVVFSKNVTYTYTYIQMESEKKKHKAKR